MKKTDAQEVTSRPMRIDRDKLRSAVRRLGSEYIFYMLDDAIELLPPSKLVKLAGRYLDVKSLQASGPKHAGLLAEVKAFEKASRAGDYCRKRDAGCGGRLQDRPDYQISPGFL
jgi:hypothetical protein